MSQAVAIAEQPGERLLMNYEKAYLLARDLANQLAPHCERVEIAGGVRRHKADVHDLELVVTPKLVPQYDMFGGETGDRNLLVEYLTWLVRSGELQPGPKQGPRFRQYRVLPSGIMLDLFIVHYPAQFGVIHAIRTGPAHYSHWLVTQRLKGGALPNDARVADGAVWVEGGQGGPLPMETEGEFFAFLDIPMPAPQDRTPAWGMA